MYVLFSAVNKSLHRNAPKQHESGVHGVLHTTVQPNYSVAVARETIHLTLLP